MCGRCADLWPPPALVCASSSDGVGQSSDGVGPSSDSVGPSSDSVGRRDANREKCSGAEAATSGHGAKSYIIIKTKISQTCNLTFVGWLLVCEIFCICASQIGNYKSVDCRSMGCRFVGCRFADCRFVGCRFVAVDLWTAYL